MSSLRFDLGDFERAAQRFDAAADQIPFAIAQSLNRAVEITRERLIDTTWAQHVTVRNPRFLQAALSTRGERATKRRLKVAIFDRLERGSLALHAEGGAKRPRGSAIAVPTRALAARRTGKGVPKGMRPTAAPNTVKKGDVIYQRIGTYKKAGKLNKGGTRAPAQDNRGLRMLYVLSPSTPIKADVPFDADFRRTMTRQVELAFGPAIAAAMATRRR